MRSGIGDFDYTDLVLQLTPEVFRGIGGLGVGLRSSTILQPISRRGCGDRVLRWRAGRKDVQQGDDGPQKHIGETQRA